jgi:hypothetical protein
MNHLPQTDRRVSPLLPRRSEAARRANAPVRRAAQAFPRLHAALDLYARWSPLLALLALALVARAVIEGLQA